MSAENDVHTKAPGEVLDYPINWATWLDGDTISSSAWTVPAGITEDSDSNTTTVATIWLSGGIVDESYELLNRIVTAGGRTRDKTITIHTRAR